MNLGKLGRSAEDRTAAFLRKNGYSVIKRNYNCRFGEIDIIAEKGEYIVFVEVKARKEDSMVAPSEAVDSSKQQKIMLTAKDYMVKTGTELQPRFDVALITVKPGSDRKGEVFSLAYTENAF